MKINFVARGKGDPAQAARNVAYSRLLGLPRVSSGNGKPLAVVGGGHSIVSHVSALRDWPGDVWAINGTWAWLNKKGVKATLFSCDAGPEHTPGVKKAVIASCVDQYVFDLLLGSDLETFDIGPGGISTGPTTATAALVLAPTLEYSSVTFFGCESSLDGDSHVYEDRAYDDLMIVEVGGKAFKTVPEFLMQAEFLSSAIRLAPQFYKQQSGGLLGALVAHGDYDVLMISNALKAKLYEAA